MVTTLKVIHSNTCTTLYRSTAALGSSSHLSVMILSYHQSLADVCQAWQDASIHSVIPNWLLMGSTDRLLLKEPLHENVTFLCFF